MRLVARAWHSNKTEHFSCEGIVQQTLNGYVVKFLDPQLKGLNWAILDPYGRIIKGRRKRIEITVI